MSSDVATAEANLNAIRDQIVDLKRREAEAVSSLLAARGAAEEARKAADWTAVRDLFGDGEFSAARLAPHYAKFDVRRYFIVATRTSNGEIMAQWEVTEHRTTLAISQVLGERAPDEVELQIRRVFDLAKARTV